jgi:hypothetical protein
MPVCEKEVRRGAFKMGYQVSEPTCGTSVASLDSPCIKKKKVNNRFLSGRPNRTLDRAPAVVLQGSYFLPLPVLTETITNR